MNLILFSSVSFLHITHVHNILSASYLKLISMCVCVYIYIILMYTFFMQNCKKNLEGQSFYAKGGRPFCKAHAR